MTRFVDDHCHILPMGLDLLKLHLGSAESHDDVIRLVRERHREQPEGWLLAVHYEQSRYGGEHLTRARLDEVSAERPILLRHVNGHAGVANTAALRLAGVTRATEDPPGGQYRRDPDGEPDGVLLETALERLGAAAPAPSHKEMVDAILAAGREMDRYGIVAAADMQTGRFGLLAELAAYAEAAERGMPVDVTLYLQFSTVFGRKATSGPEREAATARLERTGRARVRGVKIFADGAIGSLTAAVYGGYAGDPKPWAGQLIYPPERLRAMIREASEAGWSVAIHAIGDYATDLVLDGFEVTGAASRHRLEHAMLLSDVQIERIARLGVPVSMQPEFLLRFGRAYRANLGEERAAKLFRARSVLQAGIPLSFSSDRPIVSGDPREGIRAATERPGFDPSEAVDEGTATRLYSEEGGRNLGLAR